MKTVKRILLLIAGCFLQFTLLAQEDELYNLKELVHDSREEIEALALYPNDIRDAILDICLHPELLVKLGAIQSKTQESFQELIKYQPEESQKKYWELLRYPGLVEKIVKGGPKSHTEINIILKDYPEDVHTIAHDYGMSRYRTLVKIAAIDGRAQVASELLMEDYKPGTQEKVRLLLQFPEVLHIMVEHIDLVILVGEHHKNNPGLVIAKADSIRVAVARKNTEDLEAWRKGLEEDPRALAEFEEVSQQFREENGYEEDYDPMYPNSSKPKPREKEKVVKDVHVQYNYYPYPYWFGYPSWFPSIYWYRYPYWYHWGYYYGPSRSIVVLGLPSYFYFYWYFQVPAHYYRYPYLSNYIIRYYRVRSGVGPSRSGLTHSVDAWRRRSRSTVPDRLLEEKDHGIRRQKVREYGRFEEDYQRSYRRNPRETGTRDEYLERRGSRYPYLSGQRRAVKGRKSEPAPRRQYDVRSVPPTRSLELNRARERHQRTWEKSNYSRSGSRTRSTPRSSSTQRKRRN